MNKIKLIINNDLKKSEKEKFFIKKELQCILNLYAKMVSNGSWKDYSFSTGAKEVSFDVYQRASEKPVLRILKNLKPKYFNEKYLIKDKNGAILKKSENLTQLINKTSWNKLKLVKHFKVLIKSFKLSFVIVIIEILFNVYFENFFKI